MNTLRSRVIAPLAAALAIGFTMAGPAVAAPGDNNGRAEQAQTAGKSEQAPRSDNARQSARRDQTTPRNNAGDRTAGSAGGDANTSSGVQHERPNDWQAQSDPDGMDNEGVDQPGGDGGVLKADEFQDGNNGSGNDEDCEDDNRGVGVPGHCKPEPEPTPAGAAGVQGEKQAEQCPDGEVMVDGTCVTSTQPTPVVADVQGDEEDKPVTTCPTGQVMADGECADEGEVLGVEATATPPGSGAPAVAAVPDILGVGLSAPAALPQTGAAEYLTLLTIAGLAMATAGVLTLLLRRRLGTGR